MLKKYAPKSLFGRTLLIVILPIFMMQSIVTYVFFNRHWEEVTATLAKGTASDLGMLTLLWMEEPTPAARAQLINQAREELEIHMAFVPQGTIPTEDQRSIFNAFNRVFDRELDWSLDYPYWYNATGFDEEVETRVQLDDGYLIYRINRDRVVARNGHFFVIWLILATLLLGYVALVFLRNQVRSITRLAAAADAFGRGQDVGEFKPSGASEVRQAGHAFIAMRARIRRFLEQRTEMLAGVSHDLKTPLTRMRLNLALQPDTEDMKDLKADVEEMEHLLNDYLTFARGDAETVEEDISVLSLAEDVARTADRLHRQLEIDIPAHLTINGQRGSLLRAVTNLTENGFKFAEKVRLSAAEVEDHIDIVVDDDGPGIPPDQYDKALKAFTRLDDARSNATGSGLGLAIVRDVARAHGGRLHLDQSPMGGLRVIISLPQPSENALA